MKGLSSIILIIALMLAPLQRTQAHFCAISPAGSGQAINFRNFQKGTESFSKTHFQSALKSSFNSETQDQPSAADGASDNPGDDESSQIDFQCDCGKAVLRTQLMADHPMILESSPFADAQGADLRAGFLRIDRRPPKS